MASSDQAELVAARKRIAELEHERAIHRRAAELLGDVVLPKGATRRSQWCWMPVSAAWWAGRSTARRPPRWSPAHYTAIRNRTAGPDVVTHSDRGSAAAAV